MPVRLLTILDVVFILAATVGAEFLRGDLELSAARIVQLMPYLAATSLAAGFVFPLVGLNRSIWRFSSLPDYERAALAVVIVTAGAVGLAFAYNRLEGVPRSLPFLQVVLAIGLMVGARVFFRLHQVRRRARKLGLVQPLTRVERAPQHSVLVVGLNRLAEAYLLSLVEFGPGRVEVVGLLGRERRHVGRIIGAHKILGRPEDILDVLRDLEVHGVVLDRIVVTSSLETMSREAREQLLAVERAGEIEMQFLSEMLGFADADPAHEARPEDDAAATVFDIPKEQLDDLGKRPYWSLKRFGDAVLASLLLVLLSPLMLVIAIAVALDVGAPLTFWQRRPGLGGLPFRLFKFRTMSAAHDAEGRLLSDDERVSWFGRFLRRSRLDELPQLYNIARGEMSFIGPRPLLPRDQAEAHRARLLVRPGLTGWAQVVGGRIISPDDKAALDIWYVRNASFWLDVSILLRTVRLLVVGEKVSKGLVRVAWRDLHRSGALRRGGDETDGAELPTAV